MMFLPNNDAAEAQAKAVTEEMVAKEGLKVVAWRQVPIDSSVVGQFSKATQPRIWQLFVEGSAGVIGDELERQLYMVRKLIEKKKNAVMGAHAADFYFCSLSSRTMVYKVGSNFQSQQYSDGE